MIFLQWKMDVFSNINKLETTPQGSIKVVYLNFLLVVNHPRIEDRDFNR